ncbi:hypothetical protein [Botrimarina sp.]|uniref:hypothetical protein n=1 Tax=Botrimarina sp. TaxID=2795802 RepID=UPI0032EB5721
MRNELTHRLLAVVVIAAVGCTPFGRRSSVLAKAHAIGETTLGRHKSAPSGEGIEAVVSPLSGPAPEVTEKEAMAQIAPGLGQLAEGDPALHAEVLEKLSIAPPALWSLTVEQAIGTMRYRQHMAAPDRLLAETTPVALPPKPAQDREVVQASAESPASLPPTESAANDSTRAYVVNGAGQPHPAVINNVHAAQGSAAYPLTSEPSSAAIASATAPPSGAARPAPPEEPTDWRGRVASAIESLESTASQRPRNTAEAHDQVRLRLLRLALGETEQAVEPPAGLSVAEQQFWSNELWALATLLDEASGADPIARADAALRHQSEASAKLRETGSLQVRNLVAVEKVYGFGAYEPATTAAYAAGERVVLYAEIDNYTSKAAPDGYRTSIASRYRLLDSEGREAAAGDFPVDVDDLCLSRRRDFYIQYAVSLPSDLEPGEYRLELTVTDRLGDKIGADELNLTVKQR